jgi:hypothetical protein
LALKAVADSALGTTGAAAAAAEVLAATAGTLIAAGPGFTSLLCAAVAAAAAYCCWSLALKAVSDFNTGAAAAAAPVLAPAAATAGTFDAAGPGFTSLPQLLLLLLRCLVLLVFGSESCA